MTVLASLYILFSSVVPQTSYIKSVDIWFLFNLIYPFCLILLHFFIQKVKINKEVVNKVFTPREALRGTNHIREGCRKKNAAKVWSFTKPPSDPPPRFGLFLRKKIDPHFFCWKMHL